MSGKTLVWRGREIKTVGDIGCVLESLESREEAQEFMEVYFEFSPHAYQNVGYIAGYYDRDTMNRILDWCQTAHSIFGRTNPTPEEAFEAGKRWAEGEVEHV